MKKSILLAFTSLIALSLSFHTLVAPANGNDTGSFYQKVLSQIESSVEKEKASQVGLTIFRIDYATFKDAPNEIQKLLSGIIINEKRHVPLSIYLSLTNDLNFLRFVGVQSNSDDYGYTHGSDLNIIGYLPSGITLTFNSATDLYTTPVNGVITQTDNSGAGVDQYFTDENVLNLIIDNHRQNKVYFWRAELGWQQLSSKYRKSFVSADYQQLLLHKFINELTQGHTKNPINIDTDLQERDGVFLGLYVGLSKQIFKDYHSCSSSIEGEIGARETSISNADFQSMKLSLILQCQRKKTSTQFKIESGYEIIEHELGEQRTPFIDFSLKKKKWRFGFKMESSTGELINYVDYNLPNIETNLIDPIFKIYLERTYN